MKKIIITIALLYLFGISGMAQNEIDTIKGPRIVFEQMQYNFDTIIRNGNGEHTFRFTNEGNAPLLIASAFSACGCVVPEWPHKVIMPKEKASIKVKYNTNIVGHFMKVIVVKSNAVNSHKAMLRINGSVVEKNQ